MFTKTFYDQHLILPELFLLDVFVAVFYPFEIRWVSILLTFGAVFSSILGILGVAKLGQ